MSDTPHPKANSSKIEDREHWEITNDPQVLAERARALVNAGVMPQRSVVDDILQQMSKEASKEPTGDK
ncbi:MAG: hypothetical protein RLN76_03280 [Phycisphaeraceae bacterium]